MTLNEILKANGRKLEDITQIYRGKDHWCRCGCGGTYFERNRPEDARGFKRAINQMNKPDFETWDVEVGDTYINIPYDADNDKCFCVYFD